MDKIKILVVPSDTIGGVGFYRSIQPHIQLQEQFPDRFDVTIDAEPNWGDLETLSKYNILHFHKGIYENMQDFRNALSFCKSKGIVTIMDIDDNWDLGPTHPLYISQRHYKIDVMTKDNLKLADYVTTTTPIFANKIKKFNKNVFVLPNAINPEDPRFMVNRPKSDKLRIGLIMGSSHEHDMKLLNGVVSKLGKDIINKITLVLCGYDTRGNTNYINQETGEVKTVKIQPMDSVWYRYEQCITDNFKICSPHYKNFLHLFAPDSEYPYVGNENYKRCWTKDINNYYKHYNEVDVLLAPLEETDFNACKSQLKAIEACFSNTAIIASNFGPYTLDLKNIIDKGGNINEDGNALLVDKRRNHKDWVKYITKCVNNPDLVKTLQERLHNSLCEKYDLRNVTKIRADFYTSFFD